MARLNFQHLLYFWTAAREGGITKAGAALHRTPATLSGQISSFERDLGVKLFQKSGRGLVLTDQGRMAFRYADEIFEIGQELEQALRGRGESRQLTFRVGVVDSMSKLVARRLLAPALQMPERFVLECFEESPERLLARLAVHELDLVLADAPVPPIVRVKAFSHLLGTCPVAFFASPPLASRLRRGFPRSLEGAPFLMPGESSALRRPLEAWMLSKNVRPDVRAEFEDSALLKSFGQSGAGAFAAPAAVARDVTRQYGVREFGRTTELKERFYAVTVERRVNHPATIAIAERARTKVFPA